MEDRKIVELYWARDESAIAVTRDKYEPYCYSIARNILRTHEDAEECVGDTWLAAWNAMPPRRPRLLGPFLGRITRNLSFDRYRKQTADKRGGGELPLVLEELADCVSGGETPEEALDRKEILYAVNDYLDTLSARKRNLFVCRYWYADSVTDIARRYGMRETAVSMSLSRIREALRDYLVERGVAL